MKKIITVISLLILAVPVFPCWDQFQKDAKHTGEVCDVTITAPLCIKYKYPVQGGMISGGFPLSDDNGCVYTNGASGVSKFDSKMGAVVWYKDADPTINAPGMIYKNTVIYATTNNTFRAHDLATGNVVWEKMVTGTSGDFNIPDGYYNFTCFPTQSNGSIYCGNSAGDLVVVNADNGDTIKVIHVTANRLVNSPAIDDDGIVYVGSDDNNLYAVDSNTGLTKWEFNVGGVAVSAASIDSSGVYISGGPFGQVWKLNKADGSVIWTKTMGEWGFGSGALYADGYFCASDDRYVYKFDKDTGTIKWEIYTEDNFAQMSCIVVCAKVFILGCVDKMVMIDADTGNKDFVCHTLAGNYTNLGYTNGQLFFTSDDGNMYVVGQCDPSCSVCSCDAHAINATLEPTYFPPATFTPTVVFTDTSTSTFTPVPTSTVTPTSTNTPPPTPTNTQMPTATVTATKPPCDGITPPVFKVSLTVDPESSDNEVIDIASSAALQSPPIVTVCPHGASGGVMAGSVKKACEKSCLVYTASTVTGDPASFRVLYPKNTGFGDIDSITVSGTDVCGVKGTNDGSFNKNVISGDDVKIFKNVFRPDDGERCIMHYNVYGNDRVSVKIYDRTGALIVTLINNVPMSAGQYDVIWDGTKQNGQVAASGIYTAVIKTAYYNDVEKISIIR